MSVDDFERVFGARSRDAQEEDTGDRAGERTTRRTSAADSPDYRCRATSICSRQKRSGLASFARVTSGSRSRCPTAGSSLPAPDELQPGEVMPLYLFARHLVRFGTEDGAPRLMDAHCPHLGAHLGVGGRVRGDTIQCPFHGWRFQGDTGTCVEVPYDDVDFIPRKAHARAYPTIERNQMLWAWHHLEEGEPFYDVPVVPEFDDPEWSDMVVREFPVATCAQEMAENNYDTVHFQYVHGSEAIPAQDEFIDGYYKRTVSHEGAFLREGFGLGLGVLRVQGVTTFLSNTTPVDEENLLVRWLFTAPRSLGEQAAESAADQFCSGLSQDIPIWEEQKTSRTPARAAADGKGRHRTSPLVPAVLLVFRRDPPGSVAGLVHSVQPR